MLPFWFLQSWQHHYRLWLTLINSEYGRNMAELKYGRIIIEKIKRYPLTGILSFASSLPQQAANSWNYIHQSEKRNQKEKFENIFLPQVKNAAHNGKTERGGERGLFRVLSNISDERSSHRRCSIRKGVLRNFAKFTEKDLCQSLFFNKVY